MTSQVVVQHRDSLGSWLVRLVKGMLIGIGAIVPGLSGGALSVVFGLYEPLIRFLANLKHKFVRNVLFFLPVGLGLGLGVIAFSAVVDFAFEHYAAQFTWLFVGFITGTFPSLYKTSGKQGRRTIHWVALILAAAGILLLMRWMQTITNVSLTPNFGNWVLSGIIFGLGLVVPGMSPSNFLIYLGMYQPMANGISRLDLGVILPLGLGLVICVFAFAKLVAWLFNRFYTTVYHLILGVVVGSTLAIAPLNVRGWTIAVCALLFAVGAVLSYAMARLDERHPRESAV